MKVPKGNLAADPKFRALVNSVAGDLIAEGLMKEEIVNGEKVWSLTEAGRKFVESGQLRPKGVS